jgi:cytochrome c-type biogenesis protein CcmH
MMWLSFIVLLLVGLGPLIWWLVRQPIADESAKPELAFYRQQLEQAEDDDARAEVGRRILRADRQEAGTVTTTLPTNARMGWLAGLVLMTTAGSLGIYSVLGDAEAPTAPRGLQSFDEIAQGASLQQLVPYLAGQMRQKPDDPKGWALLANSAEGVGRYDIAVNAYANLVRLNPGNADLLAGWAEAHIAMDQGLVSPTARDILAEALRLKPSLPPAHYYLGLYDMQQGQPEVALVRWQALLAEGPADAPWVPVVKAAVEALEKETAP